MMADSVLTAEKYRALMNAALPSAQDANTVEPSLASLFTPDSHRLALDVDATVVRGGRGVGKTFWYLSLLNKDLRDVAAAEYNMHRLKRLEVAAGFGGALEPDRYPGPGELRRLMDERTDPYELWNAVLLVALHHPYLGTLGRWQDRISWVRDNPGERDHWIAEADKSAQADGKTVLILFDALEHLHSEREVVDRCVAGMLRLALELRLRTRCIRFKVFIRPDMFDGTLLHFPDASKLISNAANLKWSTSNLYGLFFHYLGNGPVKESSEFRSLFPGWVEPTAGRHLPPHSLLGDSEVQSDVFKAIAGPYMGANFRKGITYTWLPNHLMDGAEQVSPRSFLNALTIAVQVTIAEYAAHAFAIHHEGIRRGVQSASKTRVSEISEDMPWVNTAIDPLNGYQVPIDEAMVLDIWENSDLEALLRRQADELVSAKNEKEIRVGPRFRGNYPKLIQELIELGVMRRRKDGRLDLPDVYRIAFSIGRKGGVPRVKS